VLLIFFITTTKLIHSTFPESLYLIIGFFVCTILPFPHIGRRNQNLRSYLANFIQVFLVFDSSNFALTYQLTLPICPCTDISVMFANIPSDGINLLFGHIQLVCATEFFLQICPLIFIERFRDFCKVRINRTLVYILNGMSAFIK